MSKQRKQLKQFARRLARVEFHERNLREVLHYTLTEIGTAREGLAANANDFARLHQALSETADALAQAAPDTHVKRARAIVDRELRGFEEGGDA